MSNFISSCYRFRTISSRTYSNSQNNEETENTTLSDDSYVDPEFILYGKTMGQFK